MNSQCDFCGRLLPDQTEDGTRSPLAPAFCSAGCSLAHATSVALCLAPAYPDEPEVVVGVEPETFDMGQLCPA
jgi:hypothetical protein